MEFYRWFYQIILVLILITTGAILVFAETRPRQAAIVDTIRRTFHQGGLWITSFLVILFAFCWLTGFSYVTTLMEGDRWFVIWYLLALYTLFWSYQYWVNRFVSEKILGFFHPAQSNIPAARNRAGRRAKSSAANRDGKAKPRSSWRKLTNRSSIW